MAYDIAMEKIFLGILTRHGVEHAQVFYDEIPRVLLEKRSPLVYCMLLSPRLKALPVADLMILYQGWKAMGKLPPDARQ